MEIEYKFYLPEHLRVPELIRDPFWERYTYEPWRSIKMQADYYDDEAAKLSSAGISIRIRREDETSILTVKAPSGQEGTLSERLEWNYPVKPGTPELSQVIALLHNEPDSSSVISFLKEMGDEPLLSDMRTDVTRWEARMNFGGAFAVVSIDEGMLYGGSLREPCRELEVEYLSGEEEAFTEAALTIQEEFGLLGNTRNKLVRMLDLSRLSREAQGRGKT